MLRIATLVAALLLVSVATADFRVSPTLLLSEKYSNNLFLTEQSTVTDRVTLINPGILIQLQSADIQLAADYGITKQIVKNSSNLDMAYQDLNVNFSAYQQNNLSFASSASIQRQPVSYGRTTTSRIVVSSDIEKVQTGFVNPSLSLSNSDYTLDFDYVFGLSRYERQTQASSNINSKVLEVGSGNSHGPLAVSAKWSETDVDYVSLLGATSSFQDIYLKMSYQYTTKLQFSYRRGKERNTNSRLSTEQQGYYWNSGFSYRPKSYLLLSLSSGGRYYGRSYAGELSYQRSRITIEAGYEEETTSDATRAFMPSEGASVEPDFRSYLSVRNDIFLTKTLTSSVSYQRQRLRIQYSNSGTHRSSQGGGSFQRSYTHRFLTAYQMKRSDTLRVRYDYIRVWSNPLEGVSADKIITIDYQRQISRDLSLSLEASSRNRSGSGGSEGYKERQLAATIEMSF
ncbi:MAG: hypothetical protein L3J94_04870 [Gammaproteobacteria bacterium]|nr:hypothetical protein [Gammaproteobacteria bacterium]